MLELLTEPGFEFILASIEPELYFEYSSTGWHMQYLAVTHGNRGNHPAESLPGNNVRKGSLVATLSAGPMDSAETSSMRDETRLPRALPGGITVRDGLYFLSQVGVVAGIELGDDALHAGAPQANAATGLANALRVVNFERAHEPPARAQTAAIGRFNCRGNADQACGGLPIQVEDSVPRVRRQFD
jgi:hypothetical protein